MATETNEHAGAGCPHVIEAPAVSSTGLPFDVKLPRDHRMLSKRQLDVLLDKALKIRSIYDEDSGRALRIIDHRLQFHEHAQKEFVRLTEASKNVDFMLALDPSKLSKWRPTDL